jgi:hypothetical protein
MRVDIPSHNSYVDFPDDMPEEMITAELMKHFPPRPTHDDLEGAAITGQDSLELQDIDASVKPAVKMPIAEFLGSQISPTKPFFGPGNGSVYIFAENSSGLKDGIENIIDGNDSEILGYPDREGLSKDETTDAAVTKQGEVVTDLAQMKQHADNGNLSWAAEGLPEDVTVKASKVAEAINNRRLR